MLGEGFLGGTSTASGQSALPPEAVPARALRSGQARRCTPRSAARRPQGSSRQRAEGTLGIGIRLRKRGRDPGSATVVCQGRRRRNLGEIPEALAQPGRKAQEAPGVSSRGHMVLTARSSPPGASSFAYTSRPRIGQRHIGDSTQIVPIFYSLSRARSAIVSAIAIRFSASSTCSASISLPSTRVTPLPAAAASRHAAMMRRAHATAASDGP